MQTRFDKEINHLEQGLKLRTQRQQVLATNIANADTPNYKAQDFNFQQAMRGATDSTQSNSAGLKTTNPQHIAQQSAGNVPLQSRAQKENSADGNTVDMDVEQAQFAENALQYEALVSMISGNFKKINSVLQG